MNLTQINENLSTIIKYFHFYKTCVISAWAFGFLKNLIFWKTEALSGTRDSGNVKIFYNKA